MASKEKETKPNTAVSTSQLARQLDLFENMPRIAVESLLAICPVQQLDAEEVLIAPGQENQNLYLLVDGRLRVHLDAADSQLSFPIEPGECIGEMSIIEARRTSAYVIADEPSRVIILHEDVFWNEFVHLPGAVRNLLRTLSQRMRKHNKVMLATVEQKLRYEHLQKELDTAGKIQANILPKRAPLFPHHPQIEAYGTVVPAREVGGDFYDAFVVDEQHVCLIVGDVAGKGMPAALFMVRVMTLLRLSMTEDKDFATLLPHINAILCENNDDCMFVTLFVGLLNVQTGEMVFANGGHNAPFLSRGGDCFAPLPVPRTIMLGVADEAEYELGSVTLQPQDVLLLYTDGVTEAEGPERTFYSPGRVCTTLDRVVEADVTTMVQTLQAEVASFAAGVPQSDDITLLAVRYLGAETQP